MTLIGVIEGGCSTMIPVDSGCKSFRPLSWSRKDTPTTQKEVVSHNRVYTALCK